MSVESKFTLSRLWIEDGITSYSWVLERQSSGQGHSVSTDLSQGQSPEAR